MRDVERRCDGRIAAVGVGDEQGIAGDDRLQRLLHALCVESGQGLAEGRAGTVGGDQNRHLLARETAFAGLAAAPARLAVQLPLPLPALQNEGLVRLDDPGKPVRRLAHRLQEAVAPAKRRARRNPAALGCLTDRLAFAKRRAEGQPALLVVQPRQRRAGERAECLTAGLAPIAAQTARLAPRHRPGAAAMWTAPLVIHAQLDRRQRGRALRRVRQHRRDLLALRRRQLINMREPVPKPLVIHLPDLPRKSGTILPPVPTVCELSLFYCLKTPDVSRATSLKALLGNLRFIVTWKTWAALVVFGAEAAVGVVFVDLSP